MNIGKKNRLERKEHKSMRTIATSNSQKIFVIHSVRKNIELPTSVAD